VPAREPLSSLQEFVLTLPFLGSEAAVSVVMIRRVTGVYHADGGLRGELAYAVGRIRGTSHCALCDITHRFVWPKREWADLVAELGVPFDLVHLNERRDQIHTASAGHTPCVLAHTDRGLVLLLDPDDLERLSGDVATFGAALRRAADTAGLRWPAPPATAP
jgi:hypothetical protein